MWSKIVLIGLLHEVLMNCRKHVEKYCNLESPECKYHPHLPENAKVFGGVNLEVLNLVAISYDSY